MEVTRKCYCLLLHNLKMKEKKHLFFLTFHHWRSHPKSCSIILPRNSKHVVKSSRSTSVRALELLRDKRNSWTFLILVHTARVQMSLAAAQRKRVSWWRRQTMRLSFHGSPADTFKSIFLLMLCPETWTGFHVWECERNMGNTLDRVPLNDLTGVVSHPSFILPSVRQSVFAFFKTSCIRFRSWNYQTKITWLNAKSCFLNSLLNSRTEICKPFYLAENIWLSHNGGFLSMKDMLKLALHHFNWSNLNFD